MMTKIGKREMNSTDRYAKIREVLDMNPTPGPWDGDGYSVSRLWSNGTMGIREYIALPDTTDDHEPNPADMRFIAACDPDTLRELLDERDALAAENEKLREALRLIESAKELPPLPKASKMYDIPGYDEEELKNYARTAILADRADKLGKLAAALDEKNKEIAELRKVVKMARAVLARSLTAGYNVPGPTLADIEKAFWALDDALKSEMKAGR